MSFLFAKIRASLCFLIFLHLSKLLAFTYTVRYEIYSNGTILDAKVAILWQHAWFGGHS